MAWSIIVGNGLSIDASIHSGINESPSTPWNWPLLNPYDQRSKLLDVFPRLKCYLEKLRVTERGGVYEALQGIVFETNKRPIFTHLEKPTDNDYVHIEACHYLRIAYAWFSDQIPTECIVDWDWTKWLERNASEIETVLSYNYDIIFEKAMRIAHLGKVYGSSRQNPMFGPEFSPIPPEVYWDETKGDIRVVHVAKPHGSCNFTGIMFREVTDSNGVKKDLYPIDGVFMLRDNSLKVLIGKEMYRPVHSADLILPGEWPCWGSSESTVVAWAAEQKGHFINESAHGDKLLVAGFGYGEPDKEEFDSIVAKLPKFNRVCVVNPNPPKLLIRLLQKKCIGEVEVSSLPPNE